MHSSVMKKFLSTLPYHFSWLFDLTIGSVVLTFSFNLFVFLILLRKEILRNNEFAKWLERHQTGMIGITLLATLNTNHGRLLNSKVFRLEIFSSPMSASTEAKLRLCSLFAMVFYGGLIFFCQLYTAVVVLQTFLSPTSWGFCFNAFAILVTVTSRSIAHKQYIQARKTVEMSSLKDLQIDPSVIANNLPDEISEVANMDNQIDSPRAMDHQIDSPRGSNIGEFSFNQQQLPTTTGTETGTPNEPQMDLYVT